MSSKLHGRAVDSNTNVTVNTISIGSNVVINTTAIRIGNSSVNVVIAAATETVFNDVSVTANATIATLNDSSGRTLKIYDSSGTLVWG